MVVTGHATDIVTTRETIEDRETEVATGEIRQATVATVHEAHAESAAVAAAVAVTDQDHPRAAMNETGGSETPSATIDVKMIATAVHGTCDMAAMRQKAPVAPRQDLAKTSNPAVVQ